MYAIRSYYVGFLAWFFKKSKTKNIFELEEGDVIAKTVKAGPVNLMEGLKVSKVTLDRIKENKHAIPWYTKIKVY